MIKKLFINSIALTIIFASHLKICHAAEQFWAETDSQTSAAFLEAIDEMESSQSGPNPVVWHFAERVDSYIFSSLTYDRWFYEIQYSETFAFPAYLDFDQTYVISLKHYRASTQDLETLSFTLYQRDLNDFLEIQIMLSEMIINAQQGDMPTHQIFFSGGNHAISSDDEGVGDLCDDCEDISATAHFTEEDSRRYGFCLCRLFDGRHVVDLKLFPIPTSKSCNPANFGLPIGWACLKSLRRPGFKYSCNIAANRASQELAKKECPQTQKCTDQGKTCSIPYPSDPYVRGNGYIVRKIVGAEGDSCEVIMKKRCQCN